MEIEYTHLKTVNSEGKYIEAWLVFKDFLIIEFIFQSF